jgi:hypothetical protein
LKVEFDRDISKLPAAEQASIMAEVERVIEAIRQLGPDASAAEIRALYESLRPERWDDGELVYTLPEDVA